MSLVYLECVKEGSKLRVRIISSGYNSFANCQFPRNIRAEGRKYSVPVEDISFSESPYGKFFYRIKKTNIKILNEEIDTELLNDKIIMNIYEDKDESLCCICFSNEKDVVYATCGHYCSCYDCAVLVQKTQGKCPMCRNKIISIVKRDQISTSD